jgi:penicillin-binding protein A
VLALGVVAFGIGIVCGASGDDPAKDVATKFARAWTRGDFTAMYAQLTPEQQKKLSLESFTGAYHDSVQMATGQRLVAGNPKKVDGKWELPVFVQTRSFGPVRGTVTLPMTGGDAPHVEWSRSLTFPGLTKGVSLTRETELPQRADLLARDGSPLTKGTERAGSLGAVSAEIVGQLGPIPTGQKAKYAQLGYPDDAQVGTTGLERALETQLVGTPGGKLLAGTKVLATAAPKPAKAVRTTIDRAIEQAAIDALGQSGYLGGVAAIKPSTGEILALAGVAYSTLQPPGSTFKIITATGALNAGIVKLTDQFPYETAATLSGVQLSNANGESCGGSLVESFAESCNSVFAPLGAKLGPQKLYDQAVAFGFNRDPGIPGAQVSTIDPPDQLGDDLNVGSSAIGQGDVQATPLQMGWVASAIANRGKLPRLTLDFAVGKRRTPTTDVSSKKVALEVQQMMEAVVTSGTGTAAAVPGVKVAGKTGTAELRDTTPCDAENADPQTCSDGGPNPENTDAWFAAYAPTSVPKIAVGVMLISAGAGGDTAAPIAQQVLAAGTK